MLNETGVKDGITMKCLRFFVTNYLLFSQVFGNEETPASSHFAEDILHMSTTLIIFLACIAGALFIIKKLMKGRLNYINNTTSIKILERRALHAKASLYLIEALGKIVLISETQGHINLITEINDPVHLKEEIATPPKESFTDLLKKKLSLKNTKTK